MEVIEKLDVTLDLLVLLLASVGVTLVWRIYRIIGAVRDVIAKIVGDIQSSTATLETARSKIDSLNEEIHQRAIAALEQRLKALEERVSACQSKTDL
jgi:hypothetical protein